MMQEQSEPWWIMAMTIGIITAFVGYVFWLLKQCMPDF